MCRAEIWLSILDSFPKRPEIHDDVAPCLLEMLLNVPHDLILCHPKTYNFSHFKVRFCALPAWGRKIELFLFTASNSLFNVLLQCKLFGATPAFTVQQGRHHFSVTLNCHLNPVSHCWHSFSSGLFSSVLLLRFSFSLFCRDLIIFLCNLTCTWMGSNYMPVPLY